MPQVCRSDGYKTWIPIALFAGSVVYLVLFLHRVGYPCLTRAACSDFRIYWSGYRAISSGLNPYSPSVIQTLQKTFLGTDRLILSWNPPWFFLLFSPLLSLPFSYSSIAWFALNCALVVLSAVEAGKVFKPPTVGSTRWYISVFSLCCISIPLLYGIALGQLSSLIMFSSVLIFLGILRENNPLLLGFGIMLSSVKPHLFLAMYFPLFLWIFSTCSFFKIAKILFPLALVMVLAELWAPGSLSFWIDSFVGTPDALYAQLYPRSWISGSVAGTLFQGGLSAESANIFSLGIFALSTWWLIRVMGGVVVRRSAENNFDGKEWCRLYSLFIAVSSAVSLFGWIYDYTLMFVPSVWILSKVLSGELSLLFLFLIVAIQFFALSMFGSYHFLHQFSWYGVVMGGVVTACYLAATFKLKEGPKSLST